MTTESADAGHSSPRPRSTRGFFARDRTEFERGLGFFDAVYGFAITLLITNIDLPDKDAWSSLDSLLDSALGFQLLGLLISFAVIALFWVSNYQLLGKFRGLDSTVIAANFGATLLIVFLPFTTQAISDPAVSELPLPTAIYAGNVALAILAQSLLFETGRWRGLIVDDEPPGARWPGRLDVALKVLVFVASIPVAYLAGPAWGQLTWLLLLIVSPISGRWARSATQRLRERLGT